MTVIRNKNDAAALERLRADAPLARATEWESISNGGNLCRHTLVRMGVGKLAFKPSGGALVFYWLFLLLGLAVLVALLFAWVQESHWLVALLGISFTGFGAWMLGTQTRTAVFDRQRGALRWISASVPSPLRGMTAEQQPVALADIHALQLLCMYNDDFEDSYYFYELNLVLQDSSRVALTSCGKAARLQADARKLSEFLGIPVWDVIPSEAARSQ